MSKSPAFRHGRGEGNGGNVEEKRRRSRLSLISFFTVYDRDSGEAVGHLVDISPGGFQIIGDVECQEDRAYRFRMDFSSIMNFEQQIVFDARCMWTKFDMDVELFTSGFEMTEIRPGDLTQINRVIEQFA